MTNPSGTMWGVIKDQWFAHPWDGPQGATQIQNYTSCWGTGLSTTAFVHGIQEDGQVRNAEIDAVTSYLLADNFGKNDFNNRKNRGFFAETFQLFADQLFYTDSFDTQRKIGIVMSDIRNPTTPIGAAYARAKESPTFQNIEAFRQSFASQEVFHSDSVAALQTLRDALLASRTETASGDSESITLPYPEQAITVTIKTYVPNPTPNQLRVGVKSSDWWTNKYSPVSDTGPRRLHFEVGSFKRLLSVLVPEEELLPAFMDGLFMMMLG